MPQIASSLWNDLPAVLPSRRSAGKCGWTFLILAASWIAGFAGATIRPNIVVILADDQGWGDLGFTGNTSVATPQIDSLARTGARLDHFYVSPVCSPTRAEFLTGRYHLRSGVHDTGSGGRAAEPG